MEELHVIVSGRVQGVMMRDFVQRSAKKLGLSGYVKNLSDGTVEVVAQGEKAILEKLVERLHKGSMFSRVDRVEVEWRMPSTPYSGFVIDYRP
jgi:acylphosphatase